jgi:hypothetical protein
VSELVEAANFATPLEAELARTYLESYGISSVVFDGNSAPYLLIAIRIRLMVMDRDLQEARRLLAEYIKEGERSDRDRNRH